MVSGKFFIVLVFSVVFCAPYLLHAQKLNVALVEEGVISTPGNEFNPSFTADGRTLYIVHSLPGFKESKIMTSRLEHGKWTELERISFSDDRYRDSDPSITPDGKTLFFISNRPVDGGELPKKDYDIWRAELVHGLWSAPQPVKEVNSPQMELGVEYIKGSLYFNSTRGGEATSSDIYYSTYQNGAFTAPVSIGPPVNTPEFEADPVQSPDGNYLVYSGWGRAGGFGQGDLYICRKEGEAWSAPINLGDQVNSKFFEFTPFFSADGKDLFFCSDKYDDTQAQLDEQVLNGKFNVYRVSVEELLKSLSFKSI
ncbi:hypothetical protein [Cesiribacter sp. SM1]|uniref:hypothetical protein n=1 Tax=Cesiribacter sp. SM1 TaxID=2861196 RepID=UPI001CD5C3AF|nr:hypothetical protein [Cesiribacter sp. SM1]